MRRRVLSVLAMAVAVAFCWLRSYEVFPTQASWSGWAPEEGYVGQQFTANFDSIAEGQVFVGHVGDTSHHYNVDVYEYPDGYVPIAHSYGVSGPTSEGHVWLHFPMTPDGAGKFTRGTQYLLKVTRPNDRRSKWHVTVSVRSAA